MGHHHAVSTDTQCKVNYAIYTLQDYGYIILLFVGGAVVGGTFLRAHPLFEFFPRTPKYILMSYSLSALGS